MTDVEVLNRLRRPFDPEQIGKLPKVNCTNCSAKDRKCDKHQKRTCRTCKAYVSTQHIHIDYVGHAHVTERLLEIDPLWYWEPLAFDTDGLPAVDGNGGLWMRLHIAGHERIGYGHANGKRGGDAVKEAIGDGIRNAAMRFGVALDLWKKEPAGVVVDDEPSRQVERPQQTPEQRRAELRGQIAMLGKNKGRKVDDIAGDFMEWSRGTEVNRADASLLEDYLGYLQAQQQDQP